MKPASSGRSKTSRCSVWTSTSIEWAVSTAECPSAGTCPWLAPRTSGRAIAGGSPGSPPGERSVSPAIWITARNIANGISSSLKGEDQGVDTPGQEPRQGQWKLSNCGDKPLLHRHFRQESQHSLIPDGPALIAGRTPFFFRRGPVQSPLCPAGQEANQTRPVNSCGL